MDPDLSTMATMSAGLGHAINVEQYIYRLINKILKCIIVVNNVINIMDTSKYKEL